MAFSARIARIAGIEVKVHVTFLFIVLMSALSWSGPHGPQGALFGVLLTLLLFGSVVLHELGHSLVAKGFGIEVKEILLLPIGGIAQLSSRPKSPTQEFLIAVAGPAVNVVLVALLLIGGTAWLGLEGMGQLAQSVAAKPPPSPQTLLGLLISSNLALALFNLLPALPMDGGRMLRAGLSWFISPLKATRVAAAVARVLSVGMVGLGLYTGSPMLSFIGVFVFLGAGAESNDALVDDALSRITASAAVSPHAVKLLPNMTLAEAVRVLTQTPQTAFAVEHFGRLIGVLTRVDVLAAARSGEETAYVTGLMRRELPAVSAGMPLSQVRQVMLKSRSPFVVVYDGDTSLGLITELELAQQLAVAQALGTPPRGSAGGGKGHAVHADR